MTDTDTLIWSKMRHELWDQLSTDEHLLDIKRILNRRKRKGWIALLPNQSPAGFAEISMRDYANGCHAQPVAFLEGIWVIKPNRRQGVGLALVKIIKRDLQEQGVTELCSSAHIENAVSHSAHQSWGFDETDRVAFFRSSLV